MSLPICYPIQAGPGRFSEIITYRYNQSLSDEEFLQIWRSAILHPTAPIGCTATIRGISTSDPSLVFQITDWTSAATKKGYEESARYEPVKKDYYQLLDQTDPQLKVHYATIPGPSSTPHSCKVLHFTVCDIRKSEQDKAAKAFEEFVSDTVETERIHELFAVAESARETDTVIIVGGIRDADDLTKIRDTQGYQRLTSDLKELSQTNATDLGLFKVTHRMDFDGKGGRLQDRI